MLCPGCGREIVGGFLGCRACLQQRAAEEYREAARRHIPDILRGAFLKIRRKVKNRGIRHVELPNHSLLAFCGADLRDFRALPEEFNLGEIRVLKEACPECQRALEKLLSEGAQK